MTNWPAVALAEVCSFENGDRGKNYPGKSAILDEGIPFVNAGDLHDGSLRCESLSYISEDHFRKLNNGKFNRGDILFCLRGTLGKFALVEGDISGAIASSLIIIRPKNSIYPGYLKAYLGTKMCEGQIDLYRNGAAQPNLAASSLKKFEIPLPPLDQQRRIAAILDKADDLRRKRKHTLELLDGLIQSIFLEMFGDPVSNPKGWSTEMVGSIATKIGSGSTPKGGDASYKTSGISFVRSMNVRDEGFSRKGLAFIDEFQASKLANVVLEAGDVLLNITGASVARVCICPADIVPARVNQHVAIIRLRDKRLNQFVAASLKMPAMKTKLLGIAESGATRQAITKSQIEELELPIPPSEQIFQFNSAIERCSQVNAGIIDSLVSIESLFSSLQHRAFSDQL